MSLLVLLFTLGLLLFLLLLSTLGGCTPTSNTLGQVALLLHTARVVGFNKFDNTPIALLMILLVNGIS